MKSAYSFRGWGQNGSTTTGTVRAEDSSDARRIILERKIRPITIQEVGLGFNIRNVFVRRPPERVAFFRSLASLMIAGVDPTTAFGLLVDQVDSTIKSKNRFSPQRKNAQRFFDVVSGLRTDVIQGMKISEAMERRPNDFTDIEVAMLAAGERAGGAEHVLATLATFLERDRKFKKSIQSVLAYPFIVTGFAIITVLILSLFVVPRFVAFYADLGVPLPLSLRFFTILADLIKSVPFDLAVLITLGVGVYFGIKILETPRGAIAFDRLRMKIPIVGELISKNITISFSNILQMLTGAGETPVSALNTMVKITGSPRYAAGIMEAREALAEGRVSNLHDALAETRLFEPFYLGYIKIGLRAGNLEEMLAKVSEYYEGDVQSLVSQIPIVVQTLATLGLAVLVGSIVIPIYTSIVNLAANMH